MLGICIDKRVFKGDQKDSDNIRALTVTWVSQTMSELNSCIVGITLQTMSELNVQKEPYVVGNTKYNTVVKMHIYYMTNMAMP